MTYTNFGTNALWPTTEGRFDRQVQKGYHKNGDLQLTNETFSSKLSSSGYSRLNNVAAPALKCGDWSKLTDCKIQEVYVEGYCRCVNSELKNLTSDDYIKLKNSKVAKRIKTSDYVKLSGSTVDVIDSKYYVKISDASEVGTIKTTSYVKVNQSVVVDIKSGYYVKIKQSTVEKIKGASIEAFQSNHKTLIASQGVNLTNCKVSHLVKGGSISAKDCEDLGSIESIGLVSLTNCPKIVEIAADNLCLKQCTVEKNVVCRDPTVIGCQIMGTLEAAKKETMIKDSYVSRIVMKKAVERVENKGISNVDLNGVSVPYDIAELVKIFADGSLSPIETSSGAYEFKLNSSDEGRGRSKLNGVIFHGPCFGILMCNEKTFIGDLEVPIDALRNKSKVKKAIDFIEGVKSRSLDSIESNEEVQPQTIIVSGGHVEEIHFEEEGGVVVTVNGGSVGRIISGYYSTDEKAKKMLPVQKELKELPEEFEDPITFDVMLNPYKTPLDISGVVHHFDLKTLETLPKDKDGLFTCPLTRNKYNLEDCKPDIELKQKITDWLKLYKPA